MEFPRHVNVLLKTLSWEPHVCVLYNFSKNDVTGIAQEKFPALLLEREQPLLGRPGGIPDALCGLRCRQHRESSSSPLSAPDPHQADLAHPGVGPAGLLPGHDCTFPDLVLCTFRERPAGGAGVEEKSQEGPGGRPRPERAGTPAEEGMREGDGCTEEDGAWRGTVHGGGRGAWRGTGCTEGDGVCGGGRGAQLRTWVRGGGRAADHAHAQGGPAASPLGFPRRRCYKRWNTLGSRAPAPAEGARP